MYLESDFCCICICNKDNLIALSNVDKDKISYYDKLISAIPEMCFRGMNNARSTCDECCNVLKIVYEFRQKCLKSRTMLLDYVEPSQDDKLNDSTSNGEGNMILETQEECRKTETKAVQDDQCNFIDVDKIKTESIVDSHETDEYVEGNSLLDACVKSENDLDYDTDAPDFVQVMIHENSNKNQATTSAGDQTLKEQIEFINFLKPYECEICNKRYTYPSQLKIHMRVHLKKRTYTCDVCKKTFPNTASYNTHMRIHIIESPYNCQDCDKRCLDEAALETHRRKHLRGERIVCEVCSKEFRHAGSLTNHMRIHTGEKLYECDVCEKRFTKSSDLNRHSRVHTGFKPHKCEVCSKQFSRSDHLVKHIRTHSNKVYRCNVCNKSFVHTESLRLHMATHASELPYECKHCNKRFTKKTYQSNHWCGE